MITETDYRNAYDKLEQWLSQEDIPLRYKSELRLLEERLMADSGDKEAKDEIYERFYKDLEFGTGGLRGIMGAGSNRMNSLTVRRVTQGFADYILAKYGKSEEELSMAIAYDSRKDSKTFAWDAAGVLLANGIKAYIYDELMPTPMLSFAVRNFKSAGGIMITASHNPSIYNGYKVYNNEGCQVTDQDAAEILKYIERTDLLQGAKYADPEDKVEIIGEDTIEKYFDSVRAERAGVDCKDLEVVFTPLNGTGNKPVRRILSEVGLKKIHIVKEQEEPDGNFSTCPYPNPEKEEALNKGLELAESLKTPDLLLATDPDADRLGVAVKHGKGQDAKYTLLTGNEIGVLLLDFIGAKKKLPKKPILMKTIVSTKMADEVAAFYGAETINLLTGFKYIGEQVGILEKQKEEDRFIFGFEESYGYLSGAYVRDKDAINGAMLLCEAAAYYKAMGKTLIDRMEELYNKFGWYKSGLAEFAFEGASGMMAMAGILAGLRENPPREAIGQRIVKSTDYLEAKKTGLPASNVLEYVLADGSSIMVRPSGTEPKLKIYLSARGKSKDESEELIEKMKSEVKEWIK